jgi:acyl-CoA thioester hydrolase
MSHDPAHVGVDVPSRAGFDLAAWGIPHMSPFVMSLVVGREHVGRAVPHVSNVEYIRCLERAAVSHADSLGYDQHHLQSKGMTWFVARHEIDYKAEAWQGDELVIATWVRDMRRVRSWRDSVIVRPADQTLICRSSTLWVLVDLDSHRPRRIPPDMAARFSPLIAVPADELNEA